jgi:hypothetical protein
MAMVLLRQFMAVAMLGLATLALTQTQPPTPTPAVPSQGPETLELGASQPQEPSASENSDSSFNRWNTVLMTAFNGLLVVITIGLARIAWVQNRTSQVIERAYVTMSHYPFGLVTDGFTIQDSDRFQTQDFTVAGEITNCGSTPADVISYSVAHHVGQQLPDKPDYGDGAVPAGAFLIKGGSFVFKKTITLGAQQVEALKAGKAKLWIIGCVDYNDRFKRRYRSGYARRWNPAVPRGENNLVIEAAPGYNYDEEQ